MNGIVFVNARALKLQAIAMLLTDEIYSRCDLSDFVNE